MLNDFAYSSDSAVWPSESAFSHGILYRGQTAYYVDVSTDAGISAVKQRLANGQTCVLGVNCYSNIMYINNFDTVYTVHDKYGNLLGGHGVCIVGYDDGKVTADGTGAFRLVNSWGTSWGNQGYWWMSYYAVKTTSAGLSQGYVYYATDRTAYAPTLLGRVKLTHQARDLIDITFGIGRSKNPGWEYTFRQFRLRNLRPVPFPDNNLVFDLSDGASHLLPTDSVYVQCVDNKKDKLAGTIDYLSAQDLPWQAGVSPQTPVAIPDFNKAVMAKVKVPTSFGLPGPQGVPLAGSLVANRAECRDGALALSYDLPQAGTVHVTVYDVAGRTVAISSASARSGRNETTVKLPRVSAGVYFYRLASASASSIGRFAVIR
jgi:hypothetical protein